MTTGSLLIVVNKDVEESHGAENEGLQRAVQPHKRYREKGQDEDVGASPESAKKFVVVFVVHSFLQQLQVVWA